MRISTLHIIKKIISKLLCGCRGILSTDFSSFICNSVSLSGDYSRTGKCTPVNRAVLGNLWLTCSSHSRPYVLRKSRFGMGFRASWIVTSVQLLICVWLCDPVDCSMPGFPVHHQLPELAQTHIHRVSDTIQPSHLLLSPSPALNLFQHQGFFFQWVSSSHQVAKVLEIQLQHQSFQWIFRTDFL